ncbi:MAG TPA: MFS transporter, partial [Edaphobacter sp.]|nr:MFS transporter [Edaphobacter sp.]
MSDGESRTPNRAGDAFRSRNFRLYQSARLMVIIGAEAQSVAVAWQVYQITHSALDLGFTGLALFLPGLIFMLAAGHVADRFDRRRIILLCYALQAVCTAVLLWLSFSSWALAGGRIWPIYVVLVGIGLGRAFSGPASSALLPSLVPKDHFVNAVTWGATIYQIANMSGPAVGGLLFTLPLTGALTRWQGAPIVYLLTLAMLT